MGALKALEDIWELGKRTRREVGIVAREILALDETEYDAGSSGLVLNDEVFDMTTPFDFNMLPNTSSSPGDLFRFDQNAPTFV